MKLYIFIYQTQTDGETLMDLKSAQDIRDYVRDHKLPPDAYAIADGRIEKSFASKMDLNKLK